MKLTSFKIILAAAALLAAIFIPAASAQVTPVNYGVFTNGVITATNGQTVTVLTSGVDVRQGRGMAILPYFVGLTDPTAANTTFHFDVSYDGTNWTTTSPFSLAVTHNSTTPVRGYTNWNATLLANVAKIRLRSVVNGGTNTIYVTNVTWSVSN
jgi:hypothetical protein